MNPRIDHDEYAAGCPVDEWRPEDLGDSYEGPRPSANGHAKAETHKGSDESPVSQAEHGTFVPSVSEFPVDCLPESIRRFVVETADSIDCGLSFVALPVLAALAGAVGVKRQVTIKKGWTEFPIVWSGIVSASGTAKTPALTAAMAPVVAIEAELHEQFRRECDLYELVEDKTGIPKPKRRRLLTSDCTVEWIAGALEANPAGLLVHRDELDGWFQSFNQYRQGKGSDRANWLSLHSGGAVIVDRKASGSTFVQRAAVSIVGGIQPGILKASLTTQARDAGLGARILLAMPPRKARSLLDSEVSRSTADEYERIIRCLFSLPWNGKPVAIELAKDAKEQFRAFYNRMEREALSLDNDLAAVQSKLVATAARIALLVHLVVTIDDVSPSPVSAESMKAGIAIAEWFGKEARRIYRSLDADDDDDERSIVGFLKSVGGASTAKEVHKANRKRYPTVEEAETVLIRLVRAGVLKSSTTTNGGRPTTVYGLA